MDTQSYEDRGYLREDFRLFHLRERQQKEIPYHYHSFHKIVWLLAGRTDYAVEGCAYHLQPGDCVLVGRGCIHRPLVQAEDYYERVILYISPDYLEGLSAGDDLASCFSRAQQQSCYVYHASGELRQKLLQLEQVTDSDEFGAAILQQALFMELMVAVNRMTRQEQAVDGFSGDRKMMAILQYLGSHPEENISIDDLSERFYISKYHMMRCFRDTTGYTIHNYITEKRLLLARQLLNQGVALSEIAQRCGYQDYSTFSRAYKKQFGASPSASRDKSPALHSELSE